MSQENIQSYKGMEKYLQPGRFIDSNHPAIVSFVHEHSVANESQQQTAIRLYLAVRDGIIYDFHAVAADPRYFQASYCLTTGYGFCIPKAAALAACARAVGIPARVGYADVRNHLTTDKMDELVGSDIYTWHSYTDLYLNDRWVKATPAFNKSMCEHFGVHVLEFDGQTDSMFQELNQDGKRHLNYVNDRGKFADVPYEKILADFEALHPKWLHYRKDQQVLDSNAT